VSGHEGDPCNAHFGQLTFTLAVANSEAKKLTRPGRNPYPRECDGCGRWWLVLPSSER
jgi:hypothetical protein